jgi:hypothetical protein
MSMHQSTLAILARQRRLDFEPWISRPRRWGRAALRAAWSESFAISNFKFEIVADKDSWEFNAA